MVLSFVGKERCNIAFYTYKAIEMLGKRCLVIDNSLSADLYRSLSDGKGREKTLPNGTLLRYVDISRDDVVGYDVVILYQGMTRIDMAYEIESTAMYICTSMNRLEMEDTRKARESMGLSDCKNRIIVLDAKNSKYSPESIAQTLGLTKMSDGFDLLPIDEDDLAKYDFICESSDTTLKGSSNEFKQVIKHILTDNFELSDKTVKGLLGRI